MKLSKTIDKISENLERVKTVALLTVVLIFVWSLITNGGSKKDIAGMVETITGLNIQNELLHKDIVKLDSLKKSHMDSIARLKEEVKTSVRNQKNLEHQNRKITDRYNALAEELLRISADSSYKFLDRKAYPFEGEKRYPFNEPQIRGMHKTYLENSELQALNENLKCQKDELLNHVQLQDELIFESSSTVAIMENKEKNYEEIIENKDKEIEERKKNDRKRKRKNILKSTGVAIIALIIGFVAG